MKKFKMFAVCAISLLVLFSCKMSTKELTEEVKASMVEEYSKDGIKVEELSELIHKEGNEYTGIVTIEKDGEKADLNVEVVYDGDSFKWEAKQ